MLNEYLTGDNTIQIKRIEERNEGGTTPNYDNAQLDRLQQQLRLLRRTRRELDQNGRSFLNRVLLVCRPFQACYISYVRVK